MNAVSGLMQDWSLTVAFPCRAGAEKVGYMDVPMYRDCAVL